MWLQNSLLHCTMHMLKKGRPAYFIYNHGFDYYVFTKDFEGFVHLYYFLVVMKVVFWSRIFHLAHRSHLVVSSCVTDILLLWATWWMLDIPVSRSDDTKGITIGQNWSLLHVLVMFGWVSFSSYYIFLCFLVYSNVIFDVCPWLCRLYRAYQKLYTSMHDAGGAGPHKMQYRRDEHHGISHYHHVSNWSSHLSLWIFDILSLWKPEVNGVYLLYVQIHSQTVPLWWSIQLLSISWEFSVNWYISCLGWWSVLLSWRTSDFELYAAFDPLADKVCSSCLYLTSWWTFCIVLWSLVLGFFIIASACPGLT